MKRMKSLLALVMAIVMVLALGIPALAAGTGGDIYVANPGPHTYQAYKIFDLNASDPNNYQYTFVKAAGTDDDALLAFLQSYPDLILTETGTGTNIYTVKKTDTYSAADFAAQLAGIESSISAARHVIVDKVTTENNGRVSLGHVNDDGYYFITYENGMPFALTTVDSKDVQIQNKHDTPFDKDVWAAAPNYTRDGAGEFTGSINGDSVQLGQKLYYSVIGEVPSVGSNDQYQYLVWDKLSKGQQFNPNSIKVYIAQKTANGDINVATKTELTLAIDSVNTTPVTSTPKDTIWVNTTTVTNADDEFYTDTNPAFVVNLDVAKLNKETPTKAGYAILIEYTADVLEDVGVIDNTAHLVSNDLIKDAQTQNYVSEIVVDKFETGNASQKLAGAEFVLYKVATDADVAAAVAADPASTMAAGNLLFYRLKDNVVSWVDSGEDDIADITDWTNAVETPANAGEFNKVVTGTDGSAHFYGLADGTYKLYEIKAPNGYVRLETPVDVVVNGKASLDPNNVVDNNPTATAANQAVQLKNVSHVANTPGSVLPSTGGRGTTMLYMAGLGMMLAAGAFLIFRRRAEAGK